MGAYPLKYDLTGKILTHAIVLLANDRGVFTAFNRRDFQERSRYLTERNIPYQAFERRMRKGRWLWHPTETRFFDPNGK